MSIDDPAKAPGSAYYPPRASAQGKRLGTALVALRRLLLPLEALFHRLVPFGIWEAFWLAAILSLVPGLGHYWVEERPRKALAYFLFYAALWAWAFIVIPDEGRGLLVSALFSFHTWIMCDAVAGARRRLGLPSLRGRQAVLLSLECVLVQSLFYVSARHVAAEVGGLVRVRSEAAAPLIQGGDRLLVLRQSAYRRGDIVYSSARSSVERVIALPGEEVRIEGGRIFIDGLPLEPQAAPLGARMQQDPMLQGGVLRVPTNSYCVLFPAEHHYLRRSELLSFFMIPQELISGRVNGRFFPAPRRF